ncbi:MAG: hypothetical protein KDD64_07200 [Bdellovibrionales bacterium]|nr:hypothetical protein [Bdellovibrionales bacterium]
MTLRLLDPRIRDETFRKENEGYPLAFLFNEGYIHRQPIGPVPNMRDGKQQLF